MGFPAAYLPRVLSRRLKTKETVPPPKVVFIIGWAGMRGVVSLAAALAVPIFLKDGVTPFPHRNLILFITFIVILVTLVLQGLTLPLFIKWLKIDATNAQASEAEQEVSLTLRMAKLSLEYLQNKYPEAIENNQRLGSFKVQMEQLVFRCENNDVESEEAFVQSQRTFAQTRAIYKKAMLEIIQKRRKELNALRRQRIYDDEVVRKYESTLDLEEARIRRIN